MPRFTIHIDKREGVYDGIDLIADMTYAESERIRATLRDAFAVKSIADYGIDEDQAPGFAETFRRVAQIVAAK